MQCSVRTDRDHSCGNIKMKTNNSFKNPYKKEPNVDAIVEQVASRLQDISARSPPREAGMPTCSPEHAEAVRRYYAAFPALSSQRGASHRYLPPPAWGRAPPARTMPPEPCVLKDRNCNTKRLPAAKERRNSHHAQRKSGRKRADFEETLPEWLSDDTVWDMDGPNPVHEYIRAMALDEGYGTCENTLAEDEPRAVPGRPPPQPREPDPELYARFEAKFDRTIAALWARGQGTPDDEYQELPAELGSPPGSPCERRSALGDAVWGAPSPPLHARLRPLHLASPPRPREPPELRSFALYAGDELFDALATVADSVRSLTAINHSRDASGFAEVPPRRRPAPPAPPPPAPPLAPPPPPTEDLLTAARTHFRPIRREADAGPRYADGDTFDIRAELEPVRFRRSPAGGAYLGAERYLEYRAEERERGIDYGRLALTAAQRAAEGAAALPLRFPLRQRDAAAQTDGWAACDECAGAAKKMRPDAGIWSSVRLCRACAAPAPAAREPAPDELSHDWEELLADISAAHRQYAAEPAAAAEPPADRKRRHSAALRCARRCAHPHARFLPCAALDRPLTR